MHGTAGPRGIEGPPREWEVDRTGILSEREAQRLLQWIGTLLVTGHVDLAIEVVERYRAPLYAYWYSWSE